MSDETDITIEDCLKGAFQALLRNDLEERDRLCALAEKAFEGKDHAPADKSVLIDNSKLH